MSQSNLSNVVVGGQISINPSNQSAFGTLETAHQTPIFQGDFVYGLNSQLWSTPVVSGAGATVDTDSARLRIQCGTNSSGYAYITGRKIVRYRAGQGNLIRYTPIFTAGAANNISIMGVGSIVSNAPYDGYFFGYNGTSFGIVHYVRGTPAWTAQSSWNNDHCLTGDGSFAYDPTKGTPMMIKYPYLGFGNISFFLQNPNNGAWVLVHTIKYANTVATTQLSNPSIQFLGITINSGNTTNKTMYCGSVGIFVSGTRSFVGNPKWGADSAGLVTPGTGVKSIGTTESCLLNLRNCTTYNGITNRGALRLNSFSAGCGSTGNNLIIRFLIGATYTTTPVFIPINGATADNGVTLTSANSIASVDVAGTTITALANRGLYIYNLSISGQGVVMLDLEPYDLYVNPGETLTISGQGTAGTATTASINWSEDI